MFETGARKMDLFSSVVLGSPFPGAINIKMSTQEWSFKEMQGKPEVARVSVLHTVFWSGLLSTCFLQTRVTCWMCPPPEPCKAPENTLRCWKTNYLKLHIPVLHEDIDQKPSLFTESSKNILCSLERLVCRINATFINLLPERGRNTLELLKVKLHSAWWMMVMAARNQEKSMGQCRNFKIGGENFISLLLHTKYQAPGI